MEAKDLMIGDYISVKPSRMPIKVVAVHHKKVAYHAVVNKLAWVRESLLEPIPLTSEILKKNGFTKSTPPPGIHAICYELDNKKDRYNLNIADYNKYKRLLLHVDSEDSECFNIKCDYVHELQHALRLCGIEKEIEL